MNRAYALAELGSTHDHQDHAVFFYQKPEELTQVVCDYFLSSAHKSSECFILLARQKTWKQLKILLKNDSNSQLLSRIDYIDADLIASQLVDLQGRFQQEVFNQKIETKIEGYYYNKKSLTAFGEIVDVLCGLNFYQAAHDLEKAWHRIIQKYSLNLLCAYNHHHFVQEKNHSDFLNTCNGHSRIENPKSILSSNQIQMDLEFVNLEHEKLSHQLECEIVEKRKALASLGEIQSEVFHEIKNIISISALSAGQLNSMEKFIAPEKQARFSRLVLNITESQKKLNHIIVESMDLVRSQKEFWEKVDLHSCLLKAIHLCSEQITKVEIDLFMNIDQRSIEVLGVSEMVERIFVNILENAIHALAGNSAGTSRIIQITSLIQDGKAMVSITNNGPLIPQECLPKIFKPFYTTKKRGGTGIGLTYSKKIAQSYDGDVTCESTDAIGVRFTLILPSCNS